MVLIIGDPVSCLPSTAGQALAEPGTSDQKVIFEYFLGFIESVLVCLWDFTLFSNSVY